MPWHAPGMSDLELLRDGMRRFTDERDWAQFHDPKSLILALVGRVGSERHGRAVSRIDFAPRGEDAVAKRCSQTFLDSRLG